MKKVCLLLLVLALMMHNSYAANDSVLIRLAQTIDKTAQYDSIKVKEIEQLKQGVQANALQPQALFSLYEKIYNEYKSFKYDSAYEYAGKMIDIAYQTQNKAYLNTARLKVSFVLLSAGLYKETYDSLSSIYIRESDSAFKADYYILWGRYYYDIAAYDYNMYSRNYDVMGNKYMDSALMYLQPTSFEYYYYSGLKSYKQSNDPSAFSFLEKTLSDPNLTYHQVALAASTLSTLYQQRGDTAKTIYLLAKAADADIRSSTKEAVAIFHLAELLYKTGNIDYASIFIDYGIYNAEFYDAKQRKIEASTILPLIEAGRINGMQAKKDILVRYSTIVTVLMLLLILLAYIVLQQVRRLKKAQAALALANIKQQEVNEQLTTANKSLGEVNEKLAEADKIKEKYIGYFFNADSDYYSKIEKIKQNIEKKILDKKYEDIKFYLNKIDSRKEKEELIENFDKLFLALFPNFLKEINALLRKDENIHLKEGELLNTDMRIFALIRMGISDPEKIASILDYSVKTIYTYKSKIKSKSDIPNEEFEQRIMAIKAL